MADRDLARLVERLNRSRPLWVLLVVLGLMLLALFLPGWPGALLLVLLAGLVGVLLLARRDGPPARHFLPVLIVLLLLVAAVSKVI
jgi:hypothetical protein